MRLTLLPSTEDGAAGALTGNRGMSFRTRVEYALKRTVPRPLLSAGIYACSLAVDVADALLGRRDPMVPPTRLMHDGPRGIEVFRRDGEEFLRYLVDLADLRPGERVLDVGCGIGRKAVALASYLDESGSYEGFDIVARGVDWANRKIRTRHPNFRFHVAGVFNPRYKPSGRLAAADYRFPFDDGCFDLVISTSVFTHMKLRETRDTGPAA